MKSKFFLLILSSFVLLTGCQQSQDKDKVAPTVEFKDGLYSASYDVPDTRGWKAFIEVQVRNKAIVSANFDYVNATGDLKSADPAYADGMKKASGITPTDASKALIDALVDRQSADIQVVTGATGTYTNFKELASAVLKKAQAGDTSPTSITQPDK